MSTHHAYILKSIIAVAGGQSAFASALTFVLREVRPDLVPISQQRVSKWSRGSAIDPAVCPSIVRVGDRLGVSCSVADLHADADLIWP